MVESSSSEDCHGTNIAARATSRACPTLSPSNFNVLPHPPFFIPSLCTNPREMHERIAKRHEASSAFMEKTDEEHAEQLMRRLGARLPRDDDDFGLEPMSGPVGLGRVTGAAYADEEVPRQMQQGFVDPEVRRRREYKARRCRYKCMVIYLREMCYGEFGL